jgi:protein phosphatase 2C family protein 2/3
VHTLIAQLGNGHYFAVFDGHGGAAASTFCAKKLHKMFNRSEHFSRGEFGPALRDAFVETNSEFENQFEDDGATALASYCLRDKLFVANAGDSRAVLGIPQGQGVYAGEQITQDHKPSDAIEKKRIVESGHELLNDACIVNGKRIVVVRVDGIIACSRSIGDFAFKDSDDVEKAALTCVPDLFERPTEPGTFMVLACDGVWDVMSSEDVVQFVAKRIGDVRTDSEAEKLCEALVLHALACGSTDNTSAIVVRWL